MPNFNTIAECILFRRLRLSGYTVSQIAEKTGKSKSTVSRRLSVTSNL